MKNMLHSMLTTLYAYVVAVAVLAGAIVAILFLAAFLLDGAIAGAIASFNLGIMNFSKKLACYAIFFGLVDFYLIKEHHLCIGRNGKEEKSEPRERASV